SKVSPLRTAVAKVKKLQSPTNTFKYGSPLGSLSVTTGSHNALQLIINNAGPTDDFNFDSPAQQVTIMLEALARAQTLTADDINELNTAAGTSSTGKLLLQPNKSFLS